MPRLLLPLAALLLAALPLRAQVQQRALASEYLQRGEYDKAVVLFEALWKDDPDDVGLYREYYRCLLALQDFEALDKVLRKQVRRHPDALTFLVDRGYMEEQRGDPDAARAAYEEAIAGLDGRRQQIVQLANAFAAVNAYEYAIRTYETGARQMGGATFHYELANLHYRKGDIPAMVEAYLDFLDEDAARMANVQANLQRNLDEASEFSGLQTALYARIQREPNDARWPELLTWTFIQQRDFTAAFQQVRALDRRFDENGQRVFEFARTAQAEEAWDAAIEAYDYLVRKGPDNPFYFNARGQRVACRREKLTRGLDYSPEDLALLKGEYQAFLREYPRKDARAAETLRELADLEARYLHRLDTAAAWLERALEWGSLPPAALAGIKLDLGDCYLMQGDIWEATLLYSQVDKRMKDEPLGELARFRNARLSYFNGDFDWAQAQLEVLKASTSELVANDALDLAVFLSENLALDTTPGPMRRYARADLLVYQYRLDEAEAALDSLAREHPGHMLTDDVLWLRAEIARWRQDWTGAVALLEELRAGYGRDILADDALFTLGLLYEERLGRAADAMACYQDLLLEHPDSVFVVEARRRFRALRGDAVN